jgi:hypothetical protein
VIITSVPGVNVLISEKSSLVKPSLPDLSWCNIPKRGKIYQMTRKLYTEWPQNIPNGRRIDQRLILQDPPKCTQIGIFGLKIYHLATQLCARTGKAGSKLIYIFRQRAGLAVPTFDFRRFKSRQAIKYLEET